MAARPETILVPMPPEAAEHVWLVRLRAIVWACGKDDNVLRAVALSCYLQGALDALTPQFAAAHAAAQPEEESRG